MAETKAYLALGEEAARGTKEVATVGFVPVEGFKVPKLEINEKTRDEFRGEASMNGATTMIRRDRKWSGSFDIPFFTEAGITSAMMGTLLKHFFGHVSSAQNAATGQYAHMFSHVADPFAAANLGSKALTFNVNLPEGATIKNWPYVGGRVKGLTFSQEAGNSLVLSIDTFGQYRDASAAAIASPTYAAENLRCDYNNLTVYTGTITRTGAAPDYTDITFASATALIPDKVSLSLEDGRGDVLRLSGKDYPDKTRFDGAIKATLEITIDWEAPGSGFDSVAEYNAWVTAAGSTNFALFWDTGTQAGTGDNHSLTIDLPKMQRVGGGEPDLGLEKDPMTTLKYEGLLDSATTAYLAGVLLKNTAATV